MWNSPNLIHIYYIMFYETILLLCSWKWMNKDMINYSIFDLFSPSRLKWQAFSSIRETIQENLWYMICNIKACYFYLLWAAQQKFNTSISSEKITYFLLFGKGMDYRSVGTFALRSLGILLAAEEILHKRLKVIWKPFSAPMMANNKCSIGFIRRLSTPDAGIKNKCLISHKAGCRLFLLKLSWATLVCLAINLTYFYQIPGLKLNEYLWKRVSSQTCDT